jgi:hypothetical protein
MERNINFYFPGTGNSLKGARALLSLYSRCQKLQLPANAAKTAQVVNHKDLRIEFTDLAGGRDCKMFSAGNAIPRCG